MAMAMVWWWWRWRRILGREEEGQMVELFLELWIGVAIKLTWLRNWFTALLPSSTPTGESERVTERVK